MNDVNKIKEQSDELLVRLVEQIGVATTMRGATLAACLLAIETAASILRREARDCGAKIENVKDIQRIASMAGELAYEASGMGSAVCSAAWEASKPSTDSSDAPDGFQGKECCMT